MHLTDLALPFVVFAFFVWIASRLPRGAVDRPARCRKCGYTIVEPYGSHCPECGVSLASWDPHPRKPGRGRWSTMIRAGLCILMALLAVPWRQIEAAVAERLPGAGDRRVVHVEEVRFGTIDRIVAASPPDTTEPALDHPVADDELAATIGAVELRIVRTDGTIERWNPGMGWDPASMIMAWLQETGAADVLEAAAESRGDAAWGATPTTWRLVSMRSRIGNRDDTSPASDRRLNLKQTGRHSIPATRPDSGMRTRTPRGRVDRPNLAAVATFAAFLVPWIAGILLIDRAAERRRTEFAGGDGDDDDDTD